MTQNKTNKLIHEKSPYLLQHAYNPVDWYPWSEEAFHRAARENKPLFLSIGYSTCHWCHVMENESFEDPEVAKLMNETFVSVKVDREERPDLDHVYMTVCQILTGSGGWPLTIIMTPEKRPFFAATYIPKGTRFGRTGLMELIPRIREIWNTRRDEVNNSADQITAALKKVAQDKPGSDLEFDTLNKAYIEMTQRFDETYGGFSQAPKFPTPHNFLFMLRFWKRTGRPKPLNMVETTLQAMRQGGIYDHVGYGFHRYATDKAWLVPHFEKMLYDQAMMSMAYLEAFQATKNELYADTAREIFTYVLRDMRSPEGGFYSAEDADSEGVEGKFYTWKEEDIRQILPKEDADLIIRVFDVQKNGNFKEEASGRMTGENILHLAKPIADLAAELKIPEQTLATRIESACERLFKIREKRVHPYKDDKILTDWNGLMIAALARGAQILGNPAYEEAAENASGFILETLRDDEGRLRHRYREGEAGIIANLDDYAFLIWGLIELYEATFNSEYLKTALEVNTLMIEYFWNEKVGGFFFTPDDGEKLIVRKKEVHDGALPSGNAVAFLNLLRLARFTGDAAYDEKASEIVRAFSEQIKQYPSGYTQFLVALDFALGPSHEVVIAGASDADDTLKLLRAVRKEFIPNRVLILHPSEKTDSEIENISKFLKPHVPVNGKAAAYVCLGNACNMPTTEVEDMLEMLR